MTDECPTIYARPVSPNAYYYQATVSKGNPVPTLRFIRFLVFFFVVGVVYAQPSGGPYGPIDQRYGIPKAGKVYRAPDGKSDAAGAELAHPTTIEAAMERVVTGDAIVLRGGIYRTGGLVLNRASRYSPTKRSIPSSRAPGSRRSGRPCPTTSGGPPGRNSSRRSLSLGGIANARA